MAELDPRIGTISESDVEFPQLTISGRPLRRPVLHTRNLPDGHFAVIDPFPSVDVEAEIERLKLSLIKPKGKKEPNLEQSEPQNPGE